MRTRNKAILCKTGLVILLGLILVIFSSGCIKKEVSATEEDNKVSATGEDNKISAAEEINISFSLINNAETKLEKVRSDIGFGTYTTAKMNLNASKIDFEEALKILNNASSDYEKENQDIKRYIVFAEAGLDRVNYSEKMILFLEHLNKCIAYTDSSDLNVSKEELDKAKEDFNNSTVYLDSAKEKISSIDLDSVPVEQKSYVTILRSGLETGEKMSLEFNEMINGTYSYMNGYEFLSKGMKYFEAKKWGKAANEFGKASEKFSESKRILEPLKDSEYSEISVGAIEMCGYLTKVEKDLPHIEAGCRALEKEHYYQAEKEFNQLSSFSIIS